MNHTDVWAGIVQAPANPRLIKGGMPIEASVEPDKYISGILTAIVNGHKQSNIEYLLPWNFKG